MRPLRAILCLSLLTGALLAPRSDARAQAAVPGKEIAKKLFEDGAELEKKGEYVAALAKYREAEQITATPGLRFHKGYCLEMVGKLTGAVDEYEAADKLARDTNKTEVHAAVIARLDPLRARIPQMAIRLSTAAKDAEVQLDGNPVGTPLLDGKAFRLDPGEHAVTARAAGYRNFVRRVQVPEGVTTTVDVVLDRALTSSVTPPAPASAAAAGPFTEPPSESPRGRSLALPIATTAGAVLLAGAGIAFIVVAGSAQTDGRESCLYKTSCESEQSKVRTFDALALGSFIGAAGLGVLSAVLWTSKGGDRGAALVVRPTVTGGGALVGGTF